MSAEPVAPLVARTPHPFVARVAARRRAVDEVQLGVGSGRGIVITGLSRAEAQAVIALGPMTAGQFSEARTSRPPSHRWSAVLDRLGEAAGAVSGVPTEPGHLVLVGTGPVVRAIGEVIAGLADPLTTNPAAIAALEQGTGPRPGLVLLPANEGVAPQCATAWQRLGVPHLPVVLGVDRVCVGPLVRPERGPCLRCLDMHRADRDARWPTIAAQLTDAALDVPPVTAPADLTALAAGLVGLCVRGLLAGRPMPVGVSLSLDAPEPRIRHHLWRRHPACGCAREP